MSHPWRLNGAAAVAAILVCFGLPGLVQAQDKPKPAATAATFEIYADKGGEFRWRLKGGDGATLATSGEGYKEHGDCKKMVERIQSEIKGDKLSFEVYEDKAKEHRWRLKAKNGDIVASAPSGFKTKAEC